MAYYQAQNGVLRSIKAGRISAGRDELDQWAIESCELHRVYPPLTTLSPPSGNSLGLVHDIPTRGWALMPFSAGCRIFSAPSARPAAPGPSS